MDRLGDRIQRELGRVTPSGTSAMIAIVRAWPAAVGDENARRAWPARLARDGTLHVNATDSIWAFQLGLLAETILERLREELGDATPPALRFVAGPVPEPAAEPPARRLPERPHVAAEDARRGRSLAAGIEDEELRELVARAAAASLAKARREGP
jgi:hypothetical protein